MIRFTLNVQLKTMTKNTIVSKLNLEGKITEQHAKDIEEIIESIFQERIKEMSDKIDLAIPQVHGGGNGKRLLEQLKEDLK